MKPDLLVQNLYSTALVDPIFRKTDLNRLLIVSGYASSAMGFHHLNDLHEQNKFPKVELIYGMIQSDGISRNNHKGFQSLSKSDFPNTFTCLYLGRGEPVHAKVYIWCKDDTPKIAFTGSANYTQSALVKSQRREVLTECNPSRAFDYFKALRADSINCNDSRISKLFSITLKTRTGESRDSALLKNENKLPQTEIKRSAPTTFILDKNSPFFGLEKTTLSLLDKTGNVPKRSGLNWGQRPELRRNPNQAYLTVRGDLRKRTYFPERGTYFTVLTDDDKIIQCVRAQDGGKGIHTPHDNSEIGKYIRDRIGLASGAPVTVQDLLNYGRTTIDFYKIDDENFYMDFAAK
jgi:hypothetical protein